MDFLSALDNRFHASDCGIQVYVCHGLDGQHTGVPFANAMSPPLPSLVSQSVQSYTDGQLFWMIKNGL